MRCGVCSVARTDVQPALKGDVSSTLIRHKKQFMRECDFVQIWKVAKRNSCGTSCMQGIVTGEKRRGRRKYSGSPLSSLQSWAFPRRKLRFAGGQNTLHPRQDLPFRHIHPTPLL